MQKRKITVIISLLLVLVLSACSINLSNGTADIDSKKTESESIQFADGILEKYVRIVFGKLAGNITQEDVDKITKFSEGWGEVEYSFQDYIYDTYSDGTPHIGNVEGKIDALKDEEGKDYLIPLSYEDLKYFHNLQAISIFKAHNADFIKELKNLKYIRISVPIIDLSVFKKTSIEAMKVYSDNITNYEALLELDNLKYVDISDIPDNIAQQLEAKGVTVEKQD